MVFLMARDKSLFVNTLWFEIVSFWWPFLHHGCFFAYEVILVPDALFIKSSLQVVVHTKQIFLLTRVLILMLFWLGFSATMIVNLVGQLILNLSSISTDLTDGRVLLLVNFLVLRSKTGFISCSFVELALVVSLKFCDMFIMFLLLIWELTFLFLIMRLSKSK